MLYSVKTSYEYSLKNEALRVIETAYLIAAGFYREKNFPVLPYPAKSASRGNIVLFPKLDCSKISRFWSKVQKINYNATPVKADKKLVREVEKMLQEQKLHIPNMQKIKSQWTKSSNAIFSKINHIIPGKKNTVTDLKIYPTHFGTGTTFCVPKKFPAKIKIFLREDQNLWGLCEALLTSLTRHTVRTHLRGGWPRIRTSC